MTDPSKIPTHPAADLFPMLEGAELQDLADDIRANGQHEPVWLWEDTDRGTVLLDGRNRARACAMVGVKTKTQHYRGDDPITFSVSLNIKRRHLNTGQRAFLALALMPLYEEEAAARKRAGVKAEIETNLTADRQEGSSGKKRRAPETTDRAGKHSGTSGKSVARAKRVKEKAPDLAEQVVAGTVALDRAERVIRDREAEQKRIDQARAEAEAQPAPSIVDIRHGDFREVLADLTDVDAIITDPPYPREFLPLLGDLATWADQVLAPDGVLAVLMGQTYLPEVYRLLDGHRPYRWTCCYLTSGPAYVSHPRRLQSNWKPLILYGGGPRLADVVNSEGSDAAAKDHHKWGQDYNAFHTIVERLTQPGQTVVDPFMGSGTTLLAAHALGRHAIGADVDPASVATAKDRLL